MKPQTFFRISLATPFVLWLLCLLITLLLSGADIPNWLDPFFTPVAFYTFGIILWFFPYAILAIGLWIWSKNKPMRTLRSAALAAPICFYALMLVEASLAYLLTGSLKEFAANLPGLALGLGVLSLVFGYLCAGIAFGIFRLLQNSERITQLTLRTCPLTTRGKSIRAPLTPACTVRRHA